MCCATDLDGIFVDYVFIGFRGIVLVCDVPAEGFKERVDEFPAYLRFIETRWGLPTLTARDAAMPDMTEFFDFINKPWATPPSPPAQNMSGACDYTTQ